MCKLVLPLVLSCLSSAVVGQVPTEAAGKVEVKAQGGVEAAWQALSDAHRGRLRMVQIDDAEGRAAAMKERAAELAAFCEKFPSSVEAAKAGVEMAQIAMQNKDQDGAKAMIAKVDAGKLDMQGAIRAAMVAKTIGVAEHQQRFVAAATAQAKTIDERFELITALRLGLKDIVAADKLMADIEASVKSDDDKAAVLMGKAMIVRRSSRDDTSAYSAALAEVVKLYPASKSGKLAAAKLAAAKLAVGSEPVAFTTKDMDGKDVSPADYKGKVLLIDFWATWCGPCMLELPHVLEVYKAHHDQGFEILGISLDRDTDKDKAKLLSTIKEQGMSWRHVYDGKYWQAEIAQMYDVNSIPFTLLIGKDGKVVGKDLRGDALGEAVKAALAAK